MSVFERIAHESADDQVVNPFANGEETETVAVAIAEVQDLAYEAADEIEASEKLDGESEGIAEVEEHVEEMVQEGRSLDPVAAKLLQLNLKKLVGKRHAMATVPAHESADLSRNGLREFTRTAHEGIKDTLKQFWEAIKAQFRKMFVKIKSWMVKTFSGAKKLKERAERLQEKANSTVGTIEDKTFNFGQAKAIAVNGTFNDPGKSLKSLEKAASLIEEIVVALKKNNVEDAIEEFVNDVKKSITLHNGNYKASDKCLTDLDKSFAEFGKKEEVPGDVGNVENFKKQYGELKETDVTGIFGLPGGRAVITSKANEVGNDNDLEVIIKKVKSVKIVLGNDKYTPKEISDGDVKTLTTSQIDKVCDSVIEIASAIYTYEKNWAERDKFMTRVEKEVDNVVKDIVGDMDKDTEDAGKKERIVRSFASTATGTARRKVNFEAQLCTYGLTTGNAFLNYAERSLALHKAK